MLKNLFLILLFLSNKALCQDYYVTLDDDTINCKYLSASNYAIVAKPESYEKVVMPQFSERISFRPNEIKCFQKNNVLFLAKRLSDDSTKEKYIFLPQVNYDTIINTGVDKYDDQDVIVTTNGHTTFYIFSEDDFGSVYMGTNWVRTSGVYLEFYIYNDSLGLKELNGYVNAYSHKGIATIDLVKKFMNDRPDVQAKIKKPTHQITVYGFLYKSLTEYFGAEVYRTVKIKRSKKLNMEQTVQVSDTTTVK